MKKTLLLTATLVLATWAWAQAVAAAPISADQKMQLDAAMLLIIPPLVHAIKKLRIPAVVIPWIPPVLGALGQVVLVAIHYSSLTYLQAAMLGLGIGAAASSGYDIAKKIREEWAKK